MDQNKLQPLKSWYFDFSLMLLLAIGLFAGLEAAGRWFESRKANNSSSDEYWASSEAYSDRDYAIRLYREYRKNRNDPAAFLHWRGQPFKGKLINIDKSGNRLTIGNSTDPKSKRIFFFGGSTGWGVGVEDKDTIPSHLAKRLNERSPFNVTNFSQGGYFSTQEAVCFLLKILNNDKPDTVVFYDGFNENWVGGYSPSDFFKFEGFENWAQQQSQINSLSRILLTYWKQCRLYFALVHFHILPSSQQNYDQELLKKYSEDQISRRVVDQYLRTAEQIHKIAAANGIDAYFFWQPTLLAGTKPALSARETSVIKKTSPLFRKIVEKSYREMKARKLPPYIFNISDVLDETNKPLYVDFCHINGEGNRICANAIAKIILKGRNKT